MMISDKSLSKYVLIMNLKSEVQTFSDLKFHIHIQIQIQIQIQITLKF